MNLIESIDNHKLTSVSVYGLTIIFIIYLVVLLKENDICVEIITHNDFCVGFRVITCRKITLGYSKSNMLVLCCVFVITFDFEI